jgi:hypothetical protein
LLNNGLLKRENLERLRRSQNIRLRWAREPKAYELWAISSENLSGLIACDAVKAGTLRGTLVRVLSRIIVA